MERGIHGVRGRAAIDDHFRTAGITSVVIASRTLTRYSLLVSPGTFRDWAVPGITYRERRSRQRDQVL
ncbi:hypothetical protein LKL35_18000 [Streptomyces sp. ET3-23]|uniref:hypothetical protein n=1 Tax=Streptomyces sp. ET3-23 TaxID=2885643 RepID=UPI001D123CDE|nr:hypothetical protein [Streptomyces sp. ET3-23]MCC2277296.1 hypothetical protein [Streptomyces sp. ET3-23]